MKIERLPRLEELNLSEQIAVSKKKTIKPVYMWGVAAGVVTSLFMIGGNLYGITHHGVGMGITYSKAMTVQGNKTKIEVSEGHVEYLPMPVGQVNPQSEEQQSQPGIVVIPGNH